MYKKLMKRIADQQVDLLDKSAPEVLENAAAHVDYLYLPPKYRYTEKHMWVDREEGRRFSLVGPTEVMTWRLRSVSEVYLTESIVKARRGEIVGKITGVSAFDRKRTTIPIISPLTGVVNPVNEKLQRRFLRRARPDLIRVDPYNDGWIMAMLGESEEEFQRLLDADAYRSYLRQSVKKDPTSLYQFEDSELAASNPSRMVGIFISYRRADSGDWAYKLAERIERYYGSFGIYLDVASNKPGQDYRTVIDNYLKKTDLVVVLIGPRYFLLKNKSGKTRIHIENDTVRAEVRTSLEQKKLICPVLVDGAGQPEPSDYPEDLRELAYRQSFSIGSEDDLDEFVAMLRPDILGANEGEILKPGEHAIPGIWKTFRDVQNDYPRARTAATYQLIEMGWLLDSSVGEGNLRHPDFPQYRIRFGEPYNMVWLDVHKRSRWNRPSWTSVRGFSITADISHSFKLFSLPKDLKKAAANPDVFLDKMGSRRYPE
jgi:glycine cleavage system H lipoate-binding protein